MSAWGRFFHPLSQVQSCSHRHWVGAPSSLPASIGSFSFSSSRPGGQFQATLTSVLSAHSSWAGGWAQGQASTLEGMLRKPFPALPVPYRAASPSLGTECPGLGPQGCCSAFILAAPAGHSHIPHHAYSPAERLEGVQEGARAHDRGKHLRRNVGAAASRHVCTTCHAIHTLTRASSIPRTYRAPYEAAGRDTTCSQERDFCKANWPR